MLKRIRVSTVRIIRALLAGVVLALSRLFGGTEGSRGSALTFASEARRHLEASHFNSAEWWAKLSIKLDPHQPWGYGTLASVYFRSGDLARARQTYEEGARSVPDNPLLPTYLGHMELELGNFSSAEKAYRRALELSPNDANLYLRLAIAVRRQKRWKEAIGLLEGALELDPENPEVLVELGIAQMNSRRLEEATLTLTKAVSRAPDSVGAHYELACVLAARGRWKEAIEHARRALQLDPDNPQLQEMLTVFQGGITGDVRVSFEDNED